MADRMEQQPDNPYQLRLPNRETSAAQRSRVSIICICAPPDLLHLDQWENHLRPLEQAGHITVWSERHLPAGAPRAEQMNECLEQADLVVFLLSADFFDSDDCVELMNKAFRRHQQGKTRILPVLLRRVAWRESPLGILSCLPSNQCPVTEWTNQDAAFGDCVQDIRRMLGRPVTSSLKLFQTSAPILRSQDRQRLLRRVRSFWITGVLEQSLHGAALLALGLQEQPDAVAHPWHLVVQHPDTAPHPLPAGTRITRVYDAADGELLILGAPGSGKTTILLELARDLLDRAEFDEQHPIPVIFNLSSWATKQSPLADWLVEELNSKYQVPRKLGQRLIEADQILPLLDGLDEVAPKSRTASIQAINSYREEHGLQPLVVCSRSADYLEQSTHILLRNAVAIQPLTEQQVDDYLASGGEPLSAMRVALHQDAALRELANTPLMLSILTLAYHRMPIKNLVQGDLAATRRQIFEHYVERLLMRRVGKRQYHLEQTLRWLSWLARQMQMEGQTIFYLERMQPDWLPSSRLRLSYRWFLGLEVGFMVGLIVGLTSGLLLEFLIKFLVISIFIGVISGLSSGLIIGLRVTSDQELPVIDRLKWTWKLTHVRQNIQSWLSPGVQIWLTALTIGLSYALIASLASLLSSYLSGALANSLLDNFIVFIDILILFQAPVLFILLPALIVGLIGELIRIVIDGFTPEQLNNQIRAIPNQGIWYSGRNGLIIGFVGGLFVWLATNLITIPLVWVIWGFPNGLLIWVSIGSLCWLYSGLYIGWKSGGGAFVGHFLLRFVLQCTNVIPRNYSHFLNYVTEHLLLYKVGGGYIFIHRLLLEYFVILDTISLSDTAKSKSSRYNRLEDNAWEIPEVPKM